MTAETEVTTWKSLEVSITGHVAQVTLTGPGRGNAMGPDFWSETPEVFAQLDSNPEVRAIVLTGAGKHFTYGLDLQSMAGALGAVLVPGAMAKERADFHDMVLSMQRAANAVADCRKPVVAAISGWCIGGGVDLITAADIRYASADAKFSVREVRVAMVADMGTLSRLPGIVGEGHLRELALTGKDIDAARAEKIGLVNDVYEDQAAALAAAHATALEIAGNPPLVVHGVKAVLNHTRQADIDASLRYVAVWNAAFLPSKDLGEAMGAVFEKRTPDFKGH
ncbi:crotonase/enoyl-CoA hydratase family protein [Tomitella biformata]|uniref:crotonase/enoyl-CoA hydratase family protein n=1 Tax=Tomitella biformata TaxID=630403 RepID=UPI0004631F89|nr:crotonase/enoyl-CoA hydratase family protein [Tomitella biformata]